MMRFSTKFILSIAAISVGLTQVNPRTSTITGSFSAEMRREIPDKTNSRVETMNADIGDIRYVESRDFSELFDFPALHSLIINFAVALIIVAAIMQLLNVFFLKKDMAFIILILLIAGFASAVISGRYFHPFTNGLAERAALVADMQEKWSLWTVRTSFLALLLHVLHIYISRYSKQHNSFSKFAGFVPGANKAFMLFIALLMAVSASCVMKADDLGEQLIHVENTLQAIW
ncbi:MAG TPA: hypothetical protein VHO46_04520 [Bacteroidales bacterium]|nr:hypothetical protein [Bacteroidales bacterium]